MQQIEIKKNYYAIIPADVRYDKNLRANAKLLFGEITALCNEKGYCWASNGYFAELYECSETAISLWIKQLLDYKYIKVEVDQAAGNTRKIRINLSRLEPELDFKQAEDPPSLTNVNEGIQQTLKTSLTDVNEGIQQTLKTSLTNVKHNNTYNITENITEEEDKTASPLLLLNKTPLQAYSDGTADKLVFDFKDIDLVNEKIKQLFRNYIENPSPNAILVDQIRNELLNDYRMELSAKICWVIIIKSFMEYPGSEQRYKNINALIRKIGWKKNDFIEELSKNKKLSEANFDRKQEKEIERSAQIEKEKQMLIWINEKLETHKNILSAAEINEVNSSLQKKRIMNAHGLLQAFLFDVHKIKEDAA